MAVLAAHALTDVGCVPNLWPYACQIGAVKAQRALTHAGFLEPARMEPHLIPEEPVVAHVRVIVRHQHTLQRARWPLDGQHAKGVLVEWECAQGKGKRRIAVLGRACACRCA